MDEIKASKNKTSDPKKDLGNDAKNKDPLDEYKEFREYLRIVGEFKRRLKEIVSDSPEIETLINAVDNAVEEQNYPEATKLIENILRIVQETFKRSNDFDLDQILPTFIKR